jgi:two-component system invasion response regulator UvrY
MSTTKQHGNPPGAGLGGSVGVLTVDDEPSFRALAREVILATPGFAPQAEAASGEEAIALVSSLRPELVLIDVCMPGIGGLEAARRILATGHRSAVVLMSGDPARLRTDLAASGAVGVLPKEQLGPSMLRALWERWGHRRAG